MRLRGKDRTINWLGVISSTLTLALTLACLPACALPIVPSRIVYEDPTNFVRLELDHRVLEERPETKHTHPTMIGVNDMMSILRGVSVRDHRLKVHVWISGEAVFEPAFTETEIELLAAKLADALAKATPQERVTYYLSTPQTSVKRQITSGGLYVQGSELHFTLSNHREIYGIPAFGMVYDRRYPVLPKKFSLWDAMWGLEKDDVVIDLNKIHPAKSVASSPAD